MPGDGVGVSGFLSWVLVAFKLCAQMVMRLIACFFIAQIHSDSSLLPEMLEQVSFCPGASRYRFNLKLWDANYTEVELADNSTRDNTYAFARTIEVNESHRSEPYTKLLVLVVLCNDDHRSQERAVSLRHLPYARNNRLYDMELGKGPSWTVSQAGAAGGPREAWAMRCRALAAIVFAFFS